MPNDLARAEFWREFILTRSGYPALDRLRSQFVEAEFSEFCDCGCNSFAVKTCPDIPPLVPPGGQYGSIYEVDFMLKDEQTLEIILFAGEDGNLAYVEVDCCANSYPVPDVIEPQAEPFHTHASEGLLP